MNKYILTFYLTLLSFACIMAQDKEIEDDYLEDQIYFGLTYNSLINSPDGFQQNGFSYGLNVGFIKDIPFNTQRNIGLGIGLGYSFDAYNNNLLINKLTGSDSFTLSDDYDTNILRTSSVDIPFEFRWRTSTLEKYKFWRIYSGIKFSYIFSHKSKYRFEEVDFMNKEIDQLRKFQYGAYVSLGYNTWNFHVYYSLTSLFNDNAISNTSLPVKLTPVKMGLVFYIL